MTSNGDAFLAATAEKDGEAIQNYPPLTGYSSFGETESSEKVGAKVVELGTTLESYAPFCPEPDHDTTKTNTGTTTTISTEVDGLSGDDAAALRLNWTGKLSPPSLPSQTSSTSFISSPQSVNNGFDEEFQALLKQIRPDLTVFKERETFRSLAALVRDFRYTALTYGKVIISEKHLHDDMKSIRPVTKELGGIAGGEKYICGNVLFRFPTDKYQLYGGEGFAGKEANHQLKGLTELFNADIEALHLPLLANIDFQGSKLVAMTVLPLDRERTLCYGSSDGGGHIKNVRLEFEEHVAARLNLARHPVQEVNGGDTVYISLPCDTEVHRVVVNSEERFYMADFARLFPPQPPCPVLNKIIFEAGYWEQSKPSTLQFSRGTHLTYMLRPELVRKFEKPLSSDAFSNFASKLPEHAQYNKDVIQATEFLVSRVIPQVAADISALGSPLDQNLETVSRADLVDICNNVGESIIQKLHKEGVNVRFLGLIFDKVTNPDWRREILIEAVSRVVKLFIRGEMRLCRQNIRTAVETPFTDAVTSQLNAVLGRTECCQPKKVSKNCQNCATQESRTSSCCCMCEPNCANYRPRESKRSAPTDFTNDSTPRAGFWCYRLPGFLKERFWFAYESREQLRKQVEQLESLRFPRLTCSCCVCLWRRCVAAPRLFARLQHVCAIQLAPNAVRAFELSLAKELQVGIGQGYIMTCFGTFAPFDNESDIQEVGGRIKLLPIMEFAQGTSAVVRSQKAAALGFKDDASHLLDIAIERFSAGLAICPTDPRILCSLGMAFSYMEKYEQALEMYVSAINCKPDHGRSWFFLAQLLGNLYRRSRDKERAKRYVPVKYDLPLERGIRTLVIPRKFDAIKDKKDDKVFLSKSETAKALEKSAICCHERACELGPSNPDWFKSFANFLSHVYVSRSNSKTKDNATCDRVIKLYERALILDPQHIYARKNFAYFLGNLAERLVKKHGKAKLDDEKCSEEALFKAQLFYSNAVEHYQKLVELTPEDAMIWLNKARVTLSYSTLLMQVECKFPHEQVSRALLDLYKGIDVARRAAEESRRHGDAVIQMFASDDQVTISHGALHLLERLVAHFVPLFAMAAMDHEIEVCSHFRKATSDVVAFCSEVCDIFERSSDFAKRRCTVLLEYTIVLLRFINPTFNLPKAIDLNSLRNTPLGSKLKLPARTTAPYQLQIAPEICNQVEVELAEFSKWSNHLASLDKEAAIAMEENRERLYLQFRITFFPCKNSAKLANPKFSTNTKARPGPKHK